LGSLARAPLWRGASRRLGCKRLGFDLGDAHGEQNAPSVNLPRLGLHLAKAPGVAVGSLGAPLGGRVQGPVEPPPLALDLPLKGTQRLKGVASFAIVGHRICSLFVLFYTLSVVVATFPWPEMVAAIAPIGRETKR
jgi:hypothetical protein